jgi:hypothetical protein
MHVEKFRMVFEGWDVVLQADELDAVLVILHLCTYVFYHPPSHLQFLLDRFDLCDSQTIDA